MKHEGVIIITILHFFQGEILYVSGGRSALLILIFKKAISENKNSNNNSTLNLQNDEYLIQLERELEWFPLSSAIGNKEATIFFGIGGVINIRKYPSSISASPLSARRNFMTPPSRS